MSSDKSDRKLESVEPGPPSGAATRLSARAPSAWGAVRDAVASVHNLGALLRSINVKYKVILDLLPELRSSARLLRSAFEPAALAGAGATQEVGAYGLSRAEDLERLLDATALANEERDDLTLQAFALAGQLEASADLLALLDRASEPVPTPVSIRLIVRETGRLSGGTRGAELAVRFDEAAEDADVDVDPYVVGPLLSLLLTLVRQEGADDVVVRASRDEHGVSLRVEPAAAADAALRTIAIRVLPPIPPAARTAERVAAQLGAVLDRKGATAVLRFPARAG